MTNEKEPTMEEIREEIANKYGMKPEDLCPICLDRKKKILAWYTCENCGMTVCSDCIKGVMFSHMIYVCIKCERKVKKTGRLEKRQKTRDTKRNVANRRERHGD